MKVLGVEVPPAVAEREPVLEVPAIDMTDQSQPQDVSSAQDVARRDGTESIRQRRAKPKAGRTKKTAARAEKPKRGRDGSVGRETFTAIEALVKEGRSKTDAFKVVAERTNRSTGTVAAAYYRMARSEDALKSRNGQTKATASSASKRRAAGLRIARASAGNDVQDIDRLASRPGGLGQGSRQRGEGAEPGGRGSASSPRRRTVAVALSHSAIGPWAPGHGSGSPRQRPIGWRYRFRPRRPRCVC